MLRGGVDAVELALVLYGVVQGVSLMSLAVLACPLVWGIIAFTAGAAILVGCITGAVRCHSDRMRDYPW